MVRGLYIAGTGMLVQRQRMNTISNNIANVETTGFKKDMLVSRSFKDMMIERINDPAVVNRTPLVGPLNTGVHIDENVTAFSASGMEETERYTDFALAGDAFFCVQTPDGERYTRAGDFVVTKDGYLVTNDGYYVMGMDDKPLQVGFNEFASDELGNLYVDGESAGRMKLVQFEDKLTLRKQGDNLYYTTTEQPTGATSPTLRQGFLENSNVDISREMVDMIEVYRTYEINQRVIKTIDESLQKTCNELGRV